MFRPNNYSAFSAFTNLRKTKIENNDQRPSTTVQINQSMYDEVLQVPKTANYSDDEIEMFKKQDIEKEDDLLEND